MEPLRAARHGVSGGQGVRGCPDSRARWREETFYSPCLTDWRLAPGKDPSQIRQFMVKNKMIGGWGETPPSCNQERKRLCGSPSGGRNLGNFHYLFSPLPKSRPHLLSGWDSSLFSGAHIPSSGAALRSGLSSLLLSPLLFLQCTDYPVSIETGPGRLCLEAKASTALEGDRGEEWKVRSRS